MAIVEPSHQLRATKYHRFLCCISFGYGAQKISSPKGNHSLFISLSLTQFFNIFLTLSIFFLISHSTFLSVEFNGETVVNNTDDTGVKNSITLIKNSRALPLRYYSRPVFFAIDRIISLHIILHWNRVSARKSYWLWLNIFQPFSA